VNLKILAAVVQPAKGWGCAGGPNNSFTPLNRLINAVPPESVTAREFNDIARQMIAGNATQADWQQAERWLVQWRDNDAQLEPTLRHSNLTADLAPLSRNLNQAATIGIEVLSDLRENRAMTADRRKQALQSLKNLEQPQAGLKDMVAPSVELLVKATREE